MKPSEAIDRLKQAGWTEQAIAKAVDSHQSVINRIRHGVMQPNYDLGKRLVDLAEEKGSGASGESDGLATAA